MIAISFDFQADGWPLDLTIETDDERRDILEDLTDLVNGEAGDYGKALLSCAIGLCAPADRSSAQLIAMFGGYAWCQHILAEWWCKPGIRQHLYEARQADDEEAARHFAPRTSGLEGTIQPGDRGAVWCAAIEEFSARPHDSYSRSLLDALDELARESVVAPAAVAVTPRVELYEAYRKQDFGVLSPAAFYKRLIQRGYEEAKVQGVRCFKGVTAGDIQGLEGVL